MKALDDCPRRWPFRPSPLFSPESFPTVAGPNQTSLGPRGWCGLREARWKPSSHCPLLPVPAEVPLAQEGRLQGRGWPRARGAERRRVGPPQSHVSYRPIWSLAREAAPEGPLASLTLDSPGGDLRPPSEPEPPQRLPASVRLASAE